jgi:hypothetical protein
METMTGSLHKALTQDGRSLNEIGRMTAVDPGVLSRFLRGERTITLLTADLIIRGLGLEARLVKPRSKGGAR